MKSIWRPLSRAVMVSIIFAAAFAWGALAVRDQIFPAKIFKQVRDKITRDYLGHAGIIPRIPDRQAYIDFVNATLEDALAHWQARREALLRALVLPGTQVVELAPDDRRAFVRKFDPGGRLARHGLADGAMVFKSEYYGIPHYGLLLRTAADRAGRGLIVFIQGHQGNPLAFDYGDEFIKLAREKNFDLLLLSMTSLGFNESPDRYVVPGHGGPVEIRTESEHGIFALYHDRNFPDMTGVALMVTGNHRIVEIVIADGKYSRVAAAGISTGGWYATMLAAINPSIDLSMGFAATVPLAFRGIRKNLGDYEQVFDPIYRRYDYWDFYALATLDAKGRPSRRHVQAYNSRDLCCFDGETGAAIQDIYRDVRRIETLEFVVLDSNEHRPSVTLLRDMLSAD